MNRHNTISFSIKWPPWQHWSASFCFVLTAFIIHPYISLYFNMNNGRGIRGGRGMWERGATQHVSLAVLCSCTPLSGAGEGVDWEVGGGGDWLKEEEDCWTRSLAVPGAGPGFCVLLSLPLSLSPLRLLPACLPACLLTWLALLSDLITVYKSKASCQPHSLH